MKHYCWKITRLFFIWNRSPLCSICIVNLISVLVNLQIFVSEDSNQHSGALVFLLGQLFSSIPFLFLISISSSLVFYFLIGLHDEFSLLMYFVLNFFTCLLVNEGLVLVIAALCQDIFWSILTLVSLHVSWHHDLKLFHIPVHFVISIGTHLVEAFTLHISCLVLSVQCTPQPEDTVRSTSTYAW